MPKISDDELARLMREAEWKGVMVNTVSNIAAQITELNGKCNKTVEQREELITQIAELKTTAARNVNAIQELQKSHAEGGMTGKDKAVVYGSAITAVASIVIAALQYLPR